MNANRSANFVTYHFWFKKVLSFECKPLCNLRVLSFLVWKNNLIWIQIALQNVLFFWKKKLLILWLICSVFVKVFWQATVKVLFWKQKKTIAHGSNDSYVKAVQEQSQKQTFHLVNVQRFYSHLVHLNEKKRNQNQSNGGGFKFSITREKFRFHESVIFESGWESKLKTLHNINTTQK